MSVVGDRFVWYLDPVGAICIALLILFSWVANAFEQVWLLVGKSAPKEFVSKLIYMSMTHDPLVQKVDTVGSQEMGRPLIIATLISLSAARTMPDRNTTSKSTSLWTRISRSRSRTM